MPPQQFDWQKIKALQVRCDRIEAAVREIADYVVPQIADQRSREIILKLLDGESHEGGS